VLKPRNKPYTNTLPLIAEKTKKNMKQIIIGKLTFTRKAILIIAFGFFLTGVLLGGFIFSSIKSNSSFNIIPYLILNIPIWALLMPKISKEITEN
jgi:hypothetical protein